MWPPNATRLHSFPDSRKESMIIDQHVGETEVGGLQWSKFSVSKGICQDRKTQIENGLGVFFQILAARS